MEILEIHLSLSHTHRHKNTHIQTHTPSHHYLTVIPESEKVLENKINWPIHTGQFNWGKKVLVLSEENPETA